MSEFKDWLWEGGACIEGYSWVRNRTRQEAWAQCPNGSWLLWGAVHARVGQCFLVRAASECARRALRFVPEDEVAPRLAVDAAARWAEDPSDANRGAALSAAKEAMFLYEAASTSADSEGEPMDVRNAHTARALAALSAARAAEATTPSGYGWRVIQAAKAAAKAAGPAPAKVREERLACADAVRRVIGVCPLPQTEEEQSHA